MSDELPRGHALGLTSDNMELIGRLVAFDVGTLFSKANRFNNQDVSSPTFLFVSDPVVEDRNHQQQRVFTLRAMLHCERDIKAMVDRIRVTEPRAAVRTIRLSYNSLWSAVEYDPLEGMPCDEISISS